MMFRALLPQAAHLAQTTLAEAGPAPVDVGQAAWRLLLILLVLVAVLVVVARYGRQWLARLSRTPPGELQVRAVCPLEPRRALYLVRLRGRDYLIASSEAGLSLLRELEADDEGRDTPDDGSDAGVQAPPEGVP